MHTASWDHDLDLRGKRVAMIGTGASAVQIIPEIAEDVAHLDVFQRTPIWVGPKPDLPTPRPLRRLFRAVPAVPDAIRRVSVSLAETVLRSDERRVGKGCVRTCRFRGAPYH